jgi:hypothetical protein
VTVTVHELVPTEDPSVVDPGIVAPLMRNVEVPAPVTAGLPQFALKTGFGEAASVIPVGRLSVNPALVSGVVSVLPIVTDMRVVAPGVTVEGENALLVFGRPLQKYERAEALDGLVSPWSVVTADAASEPATFIFGEPAGTPTV